ncbi:hypothetical protein QJS04_geneDACA012289 [Acorus gramineus]|uniref:Uncharacterized protein n=1 Tax=Acorus gramineus TaxID=55184 RepID=A0AAV9A216_ACOGR|nr:hypothetical protein QJS04_geneDACA012289 [Acorus gramineus]
MPHPIRRPDYRPEPPVPCPIRHLDHRPIFFSDQLRGLLGAEGLCGFVNSRQISSTLYGESTWEENYKEVEGDIVGLRVLNKCEEDEPVRRRRVHVKGGSFVHNLQIKVLSWKRHLSKSQFIMVAFGKIPEMGCKSTCMQSKKRF